MAHAAAAHRAVTERVRRFQFDRFDPQTEEWIYYIRRFETELALHELPHCVVTTPWSTVVLSAVAYRPRRVQGSCRNVNMSSRGLMSTI